MNESGPKLEKESQAEVLQGLANTALRREAGASLKHVVQRSITALALLASLGVFEGAAQAQVRGIGPQGGWVSQVVTQAADRGVFVAQRAIDKHRSDQKEQVSSEYQHAIQTLKTARSELYWENAKGHMKDEEYNKRKVPLDAKIKQVEDEYAQVMSRGKSFKAGMFDAILRGIKGY